MESDDIPVGCSSIDRSDDNTEILEKNGNITDDDGDHQTDLSCKINESGVTVDSDNEEDLSSADGSSEDNSDNEDDDDDENSNDGNIDDSNDDADDSNGDDGHEDDNDDDWESMDEDGEISRSLDKTMNSDIDSDSSNDLSERCPICLNRFIGQTVGSPDSCDHNFCLECLLEWTKNINTCPVDRKLYNQIISRHELRGEIIDKIPVETSEKDDETDDVTYCEVCGFCDREDRLLLCDHCDKGYHCECLTPPLEHIPIMEWYCPNCSMFEGIENNDGEGSNVIRSSARAQRAIARTRASETVRLRIQQRRQNYRINITRRRRTRKQKYARRRKRTRKSTKKQSGKNYKTVKDKCKSTKRKCKRTKRKVKKRRRTKTKRSIAAARPLAAPTIRKRIAEKLGIQKPLPGHLLPRIKKPSSSCVSNIQQYNNGISTVSLFGNRNDLDMITEDFENDGDGGLVALYPRARDQLISAHNTKMADISNSFRRNIALTPLVSRENIDILGNIMQEQTHLYYKSSNIYIGRDGVLNVNKPTDGLEEKQESESSNNQEKVNNENPQSSNVSNKNNSCNYGQSSSSVASSSIDLFDSDNEKFEESTDGYTKQSCAKNNQAKPKKKNSGKLFGALNLIELYSDIEDDDNPDSAWGSGKKDSKDENNSNKENANMKGQMESDENEMSIIEKSDKLSSDRNEKLDESDKRSSEKISFVRGSIERPSYLTSHKNETYLNDKLDDDIDDNDQMEDKKEEQTDEIPDDFADVTPRVNISILPKIPKIKREKLDDKQNEETANDTGRSSVLSKLDDGSSDTKWNKRSRFNRDKNMVENKSQSEKSFHREDNSRSKSDHYRWSDDRNSRENRNWRERDNEHFRERRHNERREYDRWERPWRSDQRNDYENSNYMNDHRKKYPRDNRNNSFRERKDDYSRGKSGRSPLREYMYDKERNFGGKNNVNERGNIHRDMLNRNYRKKFSYDNLELKRQSPDRQTRNFENKKNQGENYVNKNFDQSCSDNSSALKEPLIKDPPMMREPLIKDPPMMREPLIKDLPMVKEPLIREPPMMREQMMNNQTMHEDLPSYGSARNVGLPAKRKGTPIEWDDKQRKLDDDKARERERFWENEDNERLHSKIDNTFQNTEEHKNLSTVSDFSLMSASPPSSPPDKESYDPFDPTESPKSTGNKDSKSSTLDIPLPDKNDQELKLLDEKTTKITPFPQTSFDQTSNVNTVSAPTLPNVHVPPPNYIIHSVPRAPFGNMGVSQPAMQPFNWPTPPPTILMPPALRGNFIPPPMPPRMMGPPNLQTQMTCLPPTGPMPPVMGPRGPSNTGPMIPNLPPPPLPNLNLPHQIALTNIHHPPPPPPPPPPLLGNANQNSLNNNIAHPAPHPMINAVPIRNQLFVPVTTTQLSQEQTLSVNANQVPANLHSPIQSSTTLPVQSSITTSNLTISSTVSENVLAISQTKTVSSKNNNSIVNRIVSSSSETSLKSLNSDMSNQSSAPRDVTEVVDMEVESPFSPTNSPLDFDDMSLASSGDKSTPSPNAKDDHSSISSPKSRSHSSSKFLTESVKSGTKGKSDKPSNNGKVTSTNKSSKSAVSCGQSLLEEVWAKHILGESPPKNKNAKSDTKKRSTEKIRVVRNISVKKNSLKSEKGSFKMNEDQLKILDEIPSSAVEMQVKEKYLKKLNRQERVVEEVKLALKPYYNRREIDKDEYKDILRKCVPKVCHNRSGSIIPKKIKALVEAYIEKLSHDRKKGKTKHFSNT
ncbi:LOW QUALITY PROTEIN: PHD and RING finger domain-containing protein 1-like [Centruroides vittatus]|uniref:LOW QUALITY PROTEIN: PHD and RING finger domain-containing protein 1-like n=1 Tax=Centruroides vittatus TaxID=120091 RepID=UPI00350F30E2